MISGCETGRAVTKTRAYRRPIDFKVGNFVQLDIRYFLTKYLSKKLNFPINSKFEIIEKIGNSFRFKLFNNIKVIDIFLLEKFRKIALDLLLD